MAEKNQDVAGQQPGISCPGCGAENPAGAAFCLHCGERLAQAGSAKPEGNRPRPPSARARLFGSAAVAFALGIGVSAAYFALAQPRRQPTQPARATAAVGRPLPGAATGRMPPGHPQVRLPTGHPAVPTRAEVDGIVAKAEKLARQAPKDVGAWLRYGDLALRYGMFNPADSGKAQAAFAHVLELDAENTAALRGLGDAYFDQHRYRSAVGAYQRYLKRKPDDVAALTDLGTMYLSQQNAGAAIEQYQRALGHDPRFFPAQFNLGVAYLLSNDALQARQALLKAETMAPSGAARARIDQLLAKLDHDQVSQNTNQPRASAGQGANNQPAPPPRSAAR